MITKGILQFLTLLGAIYLTAVLLRWSVEEVGALGIVAFIALAVAIYFLICAFLGTVDGIVRAREDRKRWEAQQEWRKQNRRRS